MTLASIVNIIKMQKDSVMKCPKCYSENTDAVKYYFFFRYLMCFRQNFITIMNGLEYNV